MKQPLLSILSFIFCLQFSQLLLAQEIATIEVDLQKSQLTHGLPISADLNSITHLADSLLDLVEVVNGEERSVSFQIDNEGLRNLVWILDARKSTDKRVFKLMNRHSQLPEAFLSAAVEDGGIILGTANRPLLRYQYATQYPPEGVKEIFKRSGFIHPFWSPSGKELTRIQPPDHYHHYGLWNPWTRVEYKEKVVDLWNIGDNQGTVRFANFISRTSGNIFADYKVLHEHVVNQVDGEEIAINEVQGVRIFQQENNKDIYIADISILMNCATDNAVTLKEYRYGGLGWRATEKWHRGNSETITSEGKNRVEADGSLARWVILQGEIDEGFASVLMMSFPTNYNHPEPLRIWPEDQYDRGDVFANFSPTKDKDWILEPGKNYLLKYRFFVSDNKISPEDAEQLWQQYAHPPKVKVIISD